jgi:cellulose synthase/poly-beta-1,6-N-acetylglucosamine synthase-like glycosyltransferase
MTTWFILFIAVQFIIGASFLLPMLLQLLSVFSKKPEGDDVVKTELDYAIIVTAFEQISLLPAVVNSILKLNYSNYLVYIVADKCDISTLNFGDEKVILLRPEETLGSNTKSHFYAIDNFRRKHELLTIIDSDNLVDSEYLNELNRFFNNGFVAIQGLRKAKNLDTRYACLDEAGDMYYRYIDRKLLFDVGSSASLAGSGMAFTTDLYRECLEHLDIIGAGFDKVLQIEILKKGQRIAFAETAIVYDEKTSKSTQLVNQRSRWIYTWFKYVHKGILIFVSGMISLNFNLMLSGFVFTRPPLFILGGLAAVSVTMDLIFAPSLVIFWLVCLLAFCMTFLYSLHYFKASKQVYSSLKSLPIFFYFQIVSLFKAKGANKRSVATVHFHEEIKHARSDKY